MLHGCSIAIESMENPLDFCNSMDGRKFRLQRRYNSLVSRIYESRNVVVPHQESFVLAYNGDRPIAPGSSLNRMSREFCELLLDILALKYRHLHPTDIHSADLHRLF